MKSTYVFLIGLLVQMYLDSSFQTCSTYPGKLSLIIHHIVSMYLLIGGFVYNPMYHFVFLVGILLHWMTNDNRCRLTQITNRLCGFDESRSFRDLVYHITTNRNVLYLLVLLLLVYDTRRII